ncbi:metal-sulfur cluster assembly factor [Pseudoxanthomonas sp. SGD-10]|nr:metal-sulfur cluster assembly factor [Pseudoxanthomonas sp. SGD-10]
MMFDLTNPQSFKKAQVLEALRLVIDPELQVNIIDLGLVYNVSVDDDAKVIKVEMTLSSPHCPMGNAILNSVRNCVESHFLEYQSVVELVWEPVWSYENISEEGRKHLGI